MLDIANLETDLNGVVQDSDTPLTDAEIARQLQQGNTVVCLKRLSKNLERKCTSLMRRIGICPVCGEDFQHWIDEPFAQCACGTSEWAFQDVAEEPLVVQLAWVTRERDIALERAEKLQQACLELDFIVDRIDYACGEPNEMEVSEYCVHRNEDSVLSRVKDMVEKLKSCRPHSAKEIVPDRRICKICDGGPGNAGTCLCGHYAYHDPDSASQTTAQKRDALPDTDHMAKMWNTDAGRKAFSEWSKLAGVEPPLESYEDVR